MTDNLSFNSINEMFTKAMDGIRFDKTRYDNSAIVKTETIVCVPEAKMLLENAMQITKQYLDLQIAIGHLIDHLERECPNDNIGLVARLQTIMGEK